MKKYKIEFHVHTRHSHDSILNKYFILLMCKFKRINCIAITDHNEVKGAIKYKLFLEKHNVNVIIGEEIFTSDGEIIGLFLNSKIQPNLSAEETVKLIKEQKGLVYIPHPYDEKRYKTVLKENALLKIKDSVDLVECHNGRNIDKKYSIIQESIADKYNLNKVVGSDAHTFYELGRNYCMVDSFEKNKIIDEVKKGLFVRKKCIKFAHFNTKLVRIHKMIWKGDFSGLYRIINRKFKKRK